MVRSDACPNLAKQQWTLRRFCCFNHATDQDRAQRETSHASSCTDISRARLLCRRIARAHSGRGRAEVTAATTGASCAAAAATRAAQALQAACRDAADAGQRPEL